MGGSDSLAADLPLVSAGVFLSANAHGASLHRIDFIVAIDERHSVTDVPMLEHLRALSQAPIIGPSSYADCRLTSWALGERWINSGLLALWIAAEMGAACIYLAGFDCYGAQRHVIEQAQEVAPFINCPVIVASGPLREVWPLEG